MVYLVNRYSIPRVYLTKFYNFRWHIGQSSLVQIVGIFSIIWFFSMDLKSSLRSIFLMSSGSSKSFQVAGRVHRGNLPTRLVRALGLSNCRRENFTRESKGKICYCLNKGPVCALYFASATHRIAFFCLINNIF